MSNAKLRAIQGRTRTWKHRSVHLLMESQPGQIDPEDAIRAAARSVVAEARASGWAGPPFDPSLLASLLGIHVNPSGVELDHDAMILPRPGGVLEIIWNCAMPDTRRNYAIAHEIAHTLFPDCSEMVHYRGRHRCDDDPDEEVEDLCEVAAAEMLLPYPEFADDLRAFGVTLSSLDELRLRYLASREAVAIRMMQANLTPSAMVVLTLRQKPTEERGARQTRLAFVPPPPARLRVDMMVSAPSFPGDRLFLHKSIPNASALYQLLKPIAPDRVACREVWTADRFDLPVCDIEAVRFPPDGQGRPRVAALLTAAWP